MSVAGLIRQTVIQNINSAGPGGGNNGRALFPSFGRIANVSYFTPFNTSSYNGLQLQATRRVKGAVLGFSYTLSRAVDYADDAGFGPHLELGSHASTQQGRGGFRSHSQFPVLRRLWIAVRERQALGAEWIGLPAGRRMAVELDIEPLQRHAV